MISLGLQLKQDGQVVTLKGNEAPAKPRLQNMRRSCERQKHGFVFVLFIKPAAHIKGTVEEGNISNEGSGALTQVARQLQHLLKDHEDIFQVRRVTS